MRQGYSLRLAQHERSASARATARPRRNRCERHYSLARVAQPPSMPWLVPFPQPPATVPDKSAACSSATTTNLAKLPETRCARASPTTASATSRPRAFDFADDTKLSPKVTYVNRWRLEKKDPSAALSSEASRSSSGSTATCREIPAAISSPPSSNGTRRSEKIGFKNAVEAKIQPDDAEWEHAPMPATRRSAG